MAKRGRFYRPKVVYGKSKHRDPVPMLSLAQAIYLCVEAHPELFPTMILPLATFKGHIDDLAATQAHSTTREIGSHGDRDECLFHVVSDLDFALAYVQLLVDRDRANAASIAARAGMQLVGGRATYRPPLEAQMHKTRRHCVLVRALVTHARQTHAWQYSIDGGRTWLDGGLTSQGNTTLGPFTPGMTVKFRHRTFDSKNPETDWSVPVEIVVT